MPRSHIHGSRRRFHYRSNPTDDPGNDNFRSPIPMFNASTTTYDNGCNTEIYGLIRIATDDAGSYLWLILRQIRECVTWALRKITVGGFVNQPIIKFWPKYHVGMKTPLKQSMPEPVFYGDFVL